MSFLMTKVGLNVLFSINQGVSHYNIMLLLPYVSQLSNVTSQLKDIYSLALVGAQLLVMIMMTCGIDLPEGLLILYRSGIFAIDTSIVKDLLYLAIAILVLSYSMGRDRWGNCGNQAFGNILEHIAEQNLHL